MASPSWHCIFVTELMIWHTIVVRELQNLRQIACISTTIPLFLSLIFVVGYHRSQVCIYEFSWIYFEIEAPAERSHINRALNTHLLLWMLHTLLRPGKPSEYITVSMFVWYWDGVQWACKFPGSRFVPEAVRQNAFSKSQHMFGQ